MIKSKHHMLQRAEEFSDSQELADALHCIYEDGECGTAAQYYVKECAIHIEAMYSLLMEMARRIAVDTPSALTPTTSAYPPLTELDLMARTRNCLNSQGIKTIEQLATWDLNGLLKIPNLGRKSTNEVIAVLLHFGLALLPNGAATCMATPTQEATA
jgi:DNA-directed RNA polymerase alpha subunit